MAETRCGEKFTLWRLFNKQDWAKEHKCVQCTFFLIGNAVIDPDLKATINDNALSTVDTVTYLGVTFARNAKWINHVEGIFRKCVHFFAKKLRRLSTPAEYIRKFAEACVIPIILYFSPAIFPGILKQDFALLRRSIKLISNACGLSSSYLINLVYKRHIKASSDFAARILADSEHPCMRNYQRQGHTPPPGAVLSCFPLRLQPTVTLVYRHCHGCWLTATLN